MPVQSTGPARILNLIVAVLILSSSLVLRFLLCPLRAQPELRGCEAAPARAVDGHSLRASCDACRAAHRLARTRQGDPRGPGQARSRGARVGALRRPERGPLL